jgi:hypothetical protein
MKYLSPHGMDRVVISDVLGGKDVVEGRDGRTDGRFCLLGIGRNGQILWIFSRICSNMLEYLLIGRTWTLLDVTDGQTDETDGRTHRQPWAWIGLMKLTCANDVVHPELIAKPPTNPPSWNIWKLKEPQVRCVYYTWLGLKVYPKLYGNKVE